jgi:hypothetical protein
MIGPLCATCPFANPEAFNKVAAIQGFSTTAAVVVSHVKADQRPTLCHTTSWDKEKRCLKPQSERTKCNGALRELVGVRRIDKLKSREF